MSFETELVSHMAMLRKVAIGLDRNDHRADDLVQETVMRALANKDQFTPGTNLAAWLVTILKNARLTDWRRNCRTVFHADLESTHGQVTAVLPTQDIAVEATQVLETVARLPAPQREALTLVAIRGVDYAEAAALSGVAVGTIKSRVNRAREALAA